MSLLISFGQNSLGIGERPQIVVLDLSSGSNGSSYPVTYLGSLPNDWNSTEFKTNKVILKWVDPGVFDMGQTGVTNADIVRQITLTRGFYMGIYEITGSQYEKVIGFDPSIHGGDTKPVDRGTWNEVRGGIWPSGVPSNSSFIGKVRQKTNGDIFDLPTEAQWEFVARAGTSTTYFFGDQNSEMSNYAWDNTSTGSTFEVGLKLPNPWGFFDIYGNAREYCLDYAGSYQPGPQVDPVGLSSSNSGRIIRGSGILSTAARSYVQPDDDSGLRGFRILLNTLNAFPNNLVSVAPLNIQEDQPIGSVVGEFNATDPDANATLTYHLVSGAGDGNNSLFTLDANGTLTTATVFDFESNASTYSIRVQARDEYNASVEGNFTVTLLDVFESADIQIFSNSSAGVNLNLGPGDYKLKYLSGGYLYATGRYRTHTSFAKNRSLGTDNIFFPGGDYYSVASIQSGLDPKEYDFCIETQSTVSIWHYDASYGDNSGSMWLRVEKVENIPPADLTSINSLVISENQPTGSVIGEFNATDPDANSALTYHLVSGVGDASNSLFTLDQNGTLKTATVFDFETNASTYSIRVQARDDENATVEGNFTVVLTNDIYEDSDGDGFSDFQEASAGTDPNQALSKPGLNFGLVAWYPFEGNASDMSGNGNHGTVNGATLGTDRHGKVNRAYSFDGIDDNIVIQEINSFEAQKHTLSVWVFAQQWYGDIMSKDGEASQRQWLIGSAPANGEIIAHVWTNSALYQGKSSFLLIPNQWNNIIQIWNSSSLALYINGFLQSETPTFGSLALGDQPIRIGGGAPESFPLWFNGSIDDIRIYDRALSAEEIRLLYDTEAELPAQSVTSAKLSTVLSDLIDGNGSLEQALPAGFVIARKPGEAPPPGYT
ncbi:MAG: SUMF1/EgtB/PvdO family nonheme iron enzyme, partial [Opitutae bacterium]|nr:SUMF1/EgtB/PvdO family nonheme iron enzyme [Opitutae bacterium]